MEVCWGGKREGREGEKEVSEWKGRGVGRGKSHTRIVTKFSNPSFGSLQLINIYCLRFGKFGKEKEKEKEKEKKEKKNLSHFFVKRYYFVDLFWNDISIVCIFNLSLILFCYFGG